VTFWDQPYDAEKHLNKDDDGNSAAYGTYTWDQVRKVHYYNDLDRINIEYSDKYDSCEKIKFIR